MAIVEFSGGQLPRVSRMGPTQYSVSFRRRNGWPKTYFASVNKDGSLSIITAVRKLPVSDRVHDKIADRVIVAIKNFIESEQ